MHSSRHSLHRTFLRRLLLGLILPILALLALRLFWGWEADHRLAALRSRLLAEGIRLDYTAAPVPDDQNAALAVIEALDALSLNSREKSLINDGDGKGPSAGMTWTDAHKPEVRRILAKNADVFRWVKIAAQRAAAHWPSSAAGIFYSGDHPIYHARQVANLLYDGALFAHEDHQDAQALDDLRLIFVLSRTVDQDPAELSHLIAVALRAIACQGVERIEPDLRLSQSDASADAARRLLSLLQGDQCMRDVRAIALEAEMGQISAERFRKDYSGHDSWWIRPLLIDEMARIVKSGAAEVPSLRAGDWQQAKALYPGGPRPPDSYLNAISLSVSAENSFYSLKYSELHFRCVADSGAAALLLAARLYESQTGHLPAKLEDLIPAILPTAPADPYATDHRPMRYRLDSTGPTVWSVGNNGTDEEGAALPATWNTGSFFSRFSASSDPAYNPADIVYGAARRTALETVALPLRASPAGPGPAGLPPRAFLPGWRPPPLTASSTRPQSPRTPPPTSSPAP